MNESNKKIIYDVSEGVATITFNRPELMNAVDVETHLALQEALKSADFDDDVAVIVLTGAGKAFCAGGDISGMKGESSFGDGSRVHSVGRHLIELLVQIEKPLIAKVNGAAVGLGATIALYCDIVYMSSTARIGDRHVNVGLVAGDGGAAIWPLLIGPAKAKELLMTGRLLSGSEAARIGLVSDCVEPDELDERVEELASHLASLPPYAVRATKLSVNKLVHDSMLKAFDLSLAYEHLSMKSDDHQEAVSAFLEKRRGVYTGR